MGGPRCAAISRRRRGCERCRRAPTTPPSPHIAIHHLTSERKRALFAEVFSLLEPGAMFVNMDVVRIEGPLDGLFDEQIIANR